MFKGEFQMNCLPVVEAQALLVDDDFAIDDLITLTPTPGHTAGHCCVNIPARVSAPWWSAIWSIIRCSIGSRTGRFSRIGIRCNPPSRAGASSHRR